MASTLGLLVTLIACKGLPDDRADTLAQGAVTPAEVAPGALTQMRWLVGAWRGIGQLGTMQPAFYERYSLADDSTLVVKSFKDSTMSTVTDTTRFRLRGGKLSSDIAIASKVSPTSVTFQFLKSPGNTFTWQRDDDSTWTAVIIATDSSGAPAQRVYLMRRLKED